MADATVTESDLRPLPDWVAIALVTSTSGAVLVLEILAGRVLAPYVGVNIETYTAIIGTILAGIAVGVRLGGALADRVDPRALIPALLVVGGALAIASIPIVRVLGGAVGAGGRGAPSVILVLVGFMPSAAVLSAVSPAVVKLQLLDLGRTGATVGRLSAWGTGGALVGTFLAGFVLVAYAAVTTLVVGTGVVMVLAGVVVWLAHRRPGPPGTLLSVGGVVVLAAVGHAVTEQPCEVQTGYYCITVEVDASRPSGRILVLDDLRHSYVDLEDPTYLGFWYVRRVADAIDVLAAPGPIDVVAIGGGALTIPRWVEATRPGSRQTVLEIDPELVDAVEARLGVAPGPGIDVVVGDARMTLRDLDDDSADVVVGDAFGSRAVPWHLATSEFVDDVARVLRPGGIYVVNLIDGGAESFLRAEAATIAESLPYVAVVRSAALADGFLSNAVVVASDRPIDAAAWDAARVGRGDDGALVDDVDAYLDGALVLTDDFAPVDQLVAGAR
jgi:spermidine synthase